MLALALLFLATVAAEARVSVVTTTPDLAALAREVGGELVTVESLSRPNQDPHRVTATPSMVVKISKADIFVYNGLELEIGWVPALLNSARNPNVRPGGTGHVDASRKVPLLGVPTGPVDRSMGDVHPRGNPHYTLDPFAAQWAAWNIANALIVADRKNEEKYREGLARFYRRARDVTGAAREKIRSFENQNMIVYHEGFTYLMNRIGIAEVGVIESLPGVSPSAAHVAKLIEDGRKRNIGAVVIAPWNDRGVAERIGRELDVPVVELCPAVGTCEGANDVISLFEKNVELIVRAITKSR